MAAKRIPFVIGFAAYSGTGKTKLLEQVIPILTGQGHRVGVVKHAHHAFDIDRPGKDSYRLRQAGAHDMLISSERRWALVHELKDGEEELTLPRLLRKLRIGAANLVLVEGFKHEAFPKIELCRPALGHPYLYPDDPNIVALATDAPPPPQLQIPHLDLNDPVTIANFIEALHQEYAPHHVK